MGHSEADVPGYRVDLLWDVLLKSMLHISLRVAGVSLDEFLVANQLVARLTGALGQEIVAFVQEMVARVSQRASSDTPLSSLIGLCALVCAATGHSHS